MAKKLNITAVCGWAIPEQWFSGLVEKSFPGAYVRAICPARPRDKSEARTLIEALPCDIYIGHSLGCLWLLYHKELLPDATAKIMLAPIFGCADNDTGSNIPPSQIKNLARQIKNHPDYAPYIFDFFKYCGMDIPNSSTQNNQDRETLLKGLEFLLGFSAHSIPLHDCICLVGDADALIDSEKLKIFVPQLNIIRGAGHGPEKLLAALAKFRKPWMVRQ